VTGAVADRDVPDREVEDREVANRDVAERWRAARTPIAIGLLVVLAGVLVAALSDRAERGLLDPAAVDPTGSRAVAEVLRDQGVTVDEVHTAAEVGAAGPAATVLVPFTGLLSESQLAAVRDSAADLVVVAPGAEALAALAPTAGISSVWEPVDVREPGCDLPAARAAGAVELGGELYRADGAVACYPSEGGAALLRLGSGDRTVTLLGAPDILMNGALTNEGNAALALTLLGENPRLLWFLPRPEGPAAGQERSLGELLDPGWVWATVQLGVAAVLAVLWRARRLGPVVTEPLPVVVRSAEAVEGRARLYRRAEAREHAAQVLREASRTRLAPVLGLTEPADPAAIINAVAARAGRPAAAVAALLYGSAPVDDAELVALADELDRVETEVRRS
jgi:hypothetical protein